MVIKSAFGQTTRPVFYYLQNGELDSLIQCYAEVKNINQSVQIVQKCIWFTNISDKDINKLISGLNCPILWKDNKLEWNKTVNISDSLRNAIDQFNVQYSKSRDDVQLDSIQWNKADFWYCCYLIRSFKQKGFFNQANRGYNYLFNHFNDHFQTDPIFKLHLQMEFLRLNILLGQFKKADTLQKSMFDKAEFVLVDHDSKQQFLLAQQILAVYINNNQKIIPEIIRRISLQKPARMRELLACLLNLNTSSMDNSSIRILNKSLIDLCIVQELDPSIFLPALIHIPKFSSIQEMWIRKQRNLSFPKDDQSLMLVCLKAALKSQKGEYEDANLLVRKCLDHVHELKQNGSEKVVLNLLLNKILLSNLKQFLLAGNLPISQRELIILTQDNFNYVIDNLSYLLPRAHINFSLRQYVSNILEIYFYLYQKTQNIDFVNQALRCITLKNKINLFYDQYGISEAQKSIQNQDFYLDLNSDQYVLLFNFSEKDEKILTDRLSKIQDKTKKILGGTVFQTHTLDISTLMNQKGYDLTIIFHKSQQHLYKLSFNDRSFVFSQLELDPLMQDLERFRSFLVAPSKVQKVADFASIAFRLYAELLFTDLINDVQSIRIINDQFLSGIFFEALISEFPEQKNASFRDLNYLLRDFDFIYDLPLNALLDLKKEKKQKGSCLLFMGAQTKDQNHCPVDSLESIVEGSYYSEPKYTNLNYLKKNAKDFDLIHLQMSFGDNSIFLNSDPIDPMNKGEEISINDLEGTDLNSKLLVLESLSSTNEELFNKQLWTIALQGAGVHAVVYDSKESSSQSKEVFWLNFYKALKGDFTTSQALRLAKLDWIDKNDEDIHPAEWASILLIGEDSNIEIKSPKRFIWWFIIPVFIMVCLAWWTFQGMRQRR